MFRSFLVYMFGSISLFYGILTFVGYLMQKPSLWKKSSDNI